MSSADTSTVCLNDEYSETEVNGICFQSTESGNIVIPLYELLKFSKAFQGVNINDTIQRLKNKVNSMIDQGALKIDSLKKFQDLLHEKKVAITSIDYWDLCKLCELFQVNALRKILNKYCLDHSSELNFLISLLIEHENKIQLNANSNSNDNHDDNDNDNHDDNDKHNDNDNHDDNDKHNDNDAIGLDSIVPSTDNVENILATNIEKCLNNELFGQLPISTIYRIFEKSDIEKVDSDLLYEFIEKSIEKNCFLFAFLRISKLSEKGFQALFKNFVDSKRTNAQHYYHYLPFDIEYLNEIKDDKKKFEMRIKELEKQNKELQMQNERVTENLEQNQNRIDEFIKSEKSLKTAITKLTNQNQSVCMKVRELEEEKDQLKKEKANVKFEELVKQLLSKSEVAQILMESGISFTLKSQFYIMHAKKEILILLNVLLHQKR